jgi:hypothetical protein
MGAQVKLPPGHGPYCYRIHGQIFHRTATLHPIAGVAPVFAQLYIVDSDQALNHRMKVPANSKCIPHVLGQLDLILRTINPFAQAYKMMREVELEEETRAKAEGRAVNAVNMWIKKDRKDDQRRYNAPRSNEVAVVFHNTDGEPPFERDIAVHSREGGLIQISILSGNCDPMTYPLLFPNGDEGFKLKIKMATTTKFISHFQFYSYRLAIRDEFNPILSAGKLTQQYIVDAYVKVEGNRLHFIKKEQKKLRVEMYKGLMDHIQQRAEQSHVRPGKMVILPSSFMGSPRAMQQNYQDAMCIVRAFGKPDLFITFTCNPNWKEIRENLGVNELAQNRPDLVARAT